MSMEITSANTTSYIGETGANVQGTPDIGKTGVNMDKGLKITDNLEASTPPATHAEGLGLAPPTASTADLVTLMHSLRSKVEETTIASGSEEIKNIKEQKKALAQERLEKVEEMREKQTKAEKAGIFGKIFGWIAAAAMAIAGTAMTLTGVGATVGVGLLAGGISMMAVMALQQSGGADKLLEGMSKSFEAMGMKEEAARILSTCLTGAAILAASVGAGIAGGPAMGVMVGAQFSSLLFSTENLEAMGVDKETSPWVAMGVGLGLSVISVGAGVGSAIKGTLMSGSAIAKAGTNVGLKLAESISQAMGKGADYIQKAAKVVGYIALGIEGIITMAGGGAGIGEGELQKKMAAALAGVKEFEKTLVLLQQMFLDEADNMEEIIQKIQDGVRSIMDVLDQEDMTNKTIATI